MIAQSTPLYRVSSTKMDDDDGGTFTIYDIQLVVGWIEEGDEHGRHLHPMVVDLYTDNSSEGRDAGEARQDIKVDRAYYVTSLEEVPSEMIEWRKEILEDAAKLLDEAPTPAHTCWLCEKPCEPHAFYLAPDNETAQTICEPCGEENTTDTCGCCGAKGDSVEITGLLPVTDDRFPAPTYIAMCSMCEAESDRMGRELDQE